MIQIKKTGTHISFSKKNLRKVQNKYSQTNLIKIQKFLDKSLLKFIQQTVRSAEFYPRTDRGIATESCMRQNTGINAMHFLLNDPALFKAVERITGCKKIGCFAGRMYSLIPGRGHYDHWHNDIDVRHLRYVGISVNLSERVYQGGVFKIRNRFSKKITAQIANTGFGNAFLFRISKKLQHRVTMPTGRNPRTVLAGWFLPKKRGVSFMRLGSDGTVLTKMKTRRPDNRPVSRVQIPDEVVSKRTASGRLVVNAKTRICLRLDGIASHFWELLEELKDVKAVSRAIQKEYEVDPVRLEKDLKFYVKRLMFKGLLIRVKD